MNPCEKMKNKKIYMIIKYHIKYYYAYYILNNIYIYAYVNIYNIYILHIYIISIIPARQMS